MRIAAKRSRRLGHELRARKNALRELMARCREAIVAANSKVTKAKARLSIAFERGTAHLHQVQDRFTRLTSSIAKKPQKPPEEFHARENELPVPAARFREAIVATDSKVTKVRAQLPIAIEQWTGHLLQVQNPLAGLARSIAEKPRKPPEELRTRENELPVPAAVPREATVEADSNVTKAKAQLSFVFEQGTARLRRAQETLAALGRNVVDKRRRRRQELRARESQMRELLANSLDAIVVIDADHRFVTANRRALDLFGVSERNLSKFNIDVFLSHTQIPDLQQNGSFFKGRPERHGKCVIRRLDGSLRVAEFAFAKDFLPLHLCRFYDLCMPQRPTPIHHRMGPGTQHFSQVGQAH